MHYFPNAVFLIGQRAFFLFYRFVSSAIYWPFVASSMIVLSSCEFHMFLLLPFTLYILLLLFYAQLQYLDIVLTLHDYLLAREVTGVSFNFFTWLTSLDHIA